jgi:tetratricopeptide (TPR) repeat protein
MALTLPKNPKRIPCLILSANLFLLLLSAIPVVAQHQPGDLLHEADSLFIQKNWTQAKEKYLNYLKDSAGTNLTRVRLGYCNQNLGFYESAIDDYNQALSNHPAPALKAVAESRLARIYAVQNKKELSLAHLDSAVSAGFSNVSELDTGRDYGNIRSDERFAAARQKTYAAAYPCSANEKTKEFDFWIGQWDVYITGTVNLVGQSIIQKISGGCAILENYTSVQYPYNGKSINYYDGSKGKWEQVWVGSSGVGPGTSDITHFVNGEYRDGALRFTFETTQQGQAAIGNFIFYNLGPDKVRQYQETSTDGGKSFQVSYDLTYLRKK